MVDRVILGLLASTLLLLLAALLASPAVLAQGVKESEAHDAGDASADEEGDKESDAAPPEHAFAGEIIVTPQKREQQLQEVPFSVQAFEGAALEELNVRDLNEVMTFVPGAAEELSYNVGQRRFQLRGLTQGTGDPTIGYYLDDSAFFFYGQLFAPMGRTFDIERVEVLRGPQSTLYGNGSMGGTVRYITSAPNLSKAEVHLRAAYSGTDGGDPGGYLDAAVSVPLVENRLGLRLVASLEQIGGYQEIPTGRIENTGGADVSNLRATLQWVPTDRSMVRFLYARNKADQDGGTLLASLDPSVALGQPGDFQFVDYDLYSVTVTYAFGGATLSSTTSYIDFFTDFRFSFPFPSGEIFVQHSQHDSRALNNETRLVSAGGGPLQWLTGVFYSDTELSTLDVFDPPIIAPIPDVLESESISLFGEVSWAFLDGKLVPLFGLRYFEDDRSSAAVQPDPETFDSVNPRFNLSYLATETSSYYLNVAKGFRSGDFNDPNVCRLHLQVGFPCQFAVDSDELWSYEIGTKQTLAGGQILIGAAVYYQDWIGMRQVVPAEGIFLDYHIGDAVIPGIDLELFYSPASVGGLTVQANANWNDAHLASLDPALAGASGMAEGDRLPFVPEWTAALAATYFWPITSTWMGESSLGYSHIDGQLGQIGTPAQVDNRDLLRARLGIRKGRFGYFVFGNNLLGENGAVFAQTPIGGVQAFTQDYPRQVGLEITYDLR